VRILPYTASVPKLSATIITRNEALHLGDALQSVAWADEIVVVDSHSTDDTVAIARRYTSRVEVRDWNGYVDQKNYAASIASNDWILSVDADERVTTALATEIRATLAPRPAAVAYRIPRVTWHLGRWIRSTDWYPDYQIRLYDRRSAAFTGGYVHESVSASASVGSLSAELQHYPYRNIADHVETMNRYSALAARQMHEHGRRASVFDLACHPSLAFLRNYIVRAGFCDGLAGLIVSSMNSYYVLLKFAKLWELEHSEEAKKARERP
jgi:glycosyltransferase involved in cell wall biosynthesis